MDIDIFNRKNTGDRRQNTGEGKQGVENGSCLPSPVFF